MTSFSICLTNASGSAVVMNAEIELPSGAAQPSAGFRRCLPSRWPLWLALMLFTLLTALLAAISLGRCDGHLIYALDDAYIHMAIGRNVALHGVWGATSRHFGSSSSSLLWTSLIALADWLVGVCNATPLALDAVFAIAALAWSYREGRRRRLPPAVNAVMLVVLVASCPLATLVLSGMEHTLQIFVDLVFFFLACRVADMTSSPDDTHAWRKPRALAMTILAAAVVMVRFEGLFLVAAVCLVLAWRRRWALSLALCLAAWLPVAAYGFWSTRHGGLWLPNSVLIKANSLSFHTPGGVFLALGGRALMQLLTHGPATLYVLAASILLGLGWFFDRAHTHKGRTFLFVAIITSLLHFQFAEIGWLFRYEAYLVWMLVVAFFLAADDWFGSRRCLSRAPRFQLTALILAAALLAIGIGYRCARSVRLTLKAAPSIYRQQYQMGRFLARYYDGQSIAAHDIGAISYQTRDIDLLDIMGLDTTEVTRRKLARLTTGPWLAELARQHGVKIVMVYDSWLDKYAGHPPGWIKVASWTIADIGICGDNTVCFYVTDPGAASSLQIHLHEFSAQLPDGMSVTDENATAHR